MKEYFRRGWAFLKDDSRRAFRIRRMLMSAASVLGAKAINLMVMLLSVPLTYKYLGEERFGLLMLILSLIMLMTFADLGLGYGLLNKIAKYDVARDYESLKKAVSSTFFFLLGVSIVLLAIFLVLHTFISWGELFNVSSPEAQAEARVAILIFTICFCVTLPFTIVGKFQSGYQEIHISQIWEAGGNLFSLAMLVIAVRLEAGVPMILLAIYGSQCLFTVLNFGYQFLMRRRHLLPSILAFDARIFRSIFQEAMMICGLQVFSMVISAIDSVLIAHFVNPVAVGVYAIGYRLFSVFILPLQAFLSSVLPAFNDAWASNDLQWIRGNLRRAYVIVLVASAFLGLMYFLLSNYIVALWISPDVQILLPLLIAFSCYIIYQNVSSLIFSVMMSPIFLKRLFTLYAIAAVVILLAKVIVVQYLHYSSILWATMIGATLIFFIPGYQTIRYRLRLFDDQPAVSTQFVSSK